MTNVSWIVADAILKRVGSATNAKTFSADAVLCQAKQRKFAQPIHDGHIWKERVRGGIPRIRGEDRFFVVYD